MKQKEYLALEVKNHKVFSKRFEYEIASGKPIPITDDLINESEVCAKRRFNIITRSIIAGLTLLLVVMYFMLQCDPRSSGDDNLFVIIVSSIFIYVSTLITALLIKKYSIHLSQNRYLMPIFKYNSMFGGDFEEAYKQSLKIKTKGEFNSNMALLASLFLK